MTRRERLRKNVKNTVSDLVSAFLYYDRKEDETLSRDDIAEVFREGYVTEDEVVRWFRRELTPSLEALGNMSSPNEGTDG